MKDSIKLSVKIAAAFLGSLIGAGFASGQEVLIFFARFGAYGFWGVILSLALLFVLLVSLNNYILKENITDFKQFIFSITGRTTAWFFYLVFFIFTYISFGVMASGFGAAMHQHLGMEIKLGAILFLIIMVFILLFDQKGMVMVNLILTPIMIVGVLGICLVFFANRDVMAAAMSGSNILLPPWAKSAILYSGYNAVIGIAVICGLGNLMKNKKVSWICSILSIGIFGIVLVFLYLLLYSNFEGLSLFHIPMLYAATAVNAKAGSLYFLILLMAMLTTGAGCGYVLCQALKWKKQTSAILLAICALPFVFFDFSQLVANLYSFFGIFGSLLVFIIIYKIGIRPLFQRKTIKGKK